jgi:predicted ATP-dependent Lon-type protease
MPSPVSSVLLRIPNDDLPKLRDYFLAQDGGLTITQFIAVFVKLMIKVMVTDFVPIPVNPI